MGGRRTITQVAALPGRLVAPLPNAPAPRYFGTLPTVWNPSPPPDPDFVSPALLIAHGVTLIFDGSGTATLTADPCPPRSQRAPEPVNTPGSFRRMYRLVRDMGVELCR